MREQDAEYDEWADQLEATSREHQWDTEGKHAGRPFPRDAGGYLINPAPEPYRAAMNDSGWTIRVYRATSCLRTNIET